MDHIVTEDPSGRGAWILILGCPRPQSHTLHDAERNVSGPTFAFCAACEHQVGLNVEGRDSESDWSLDAYPERLRCGFHDGHSLGSAD